jgi:phospholipid/cholesterol/gamma-HCH transport system substrate-binding protein
MRERNFETFIGFVVLLIAGWFVVYAMQLTNNSVAEDNYSLEADFQDIDGLTTGSDVKISGIKVGYVNSITLEPDTYFARVHIAVNNGVLVPRDSRVSVVSSGLIGGKYIRITPGSSDDFLKNKEKIKFTQSSLSIEDLINKFVYNFTNK